MTWTNTDNSVFFSRNDPTDLRFGDRAKIFDFSDSSPLLQEGYLLWGYADDEGISANGGRIGARFGPDAIRRAFYKFTDNLDLGQGYSILDGGTLHPGKESLHERHEEASARALSFFQSRRLCLSLGGGHDYAYVDGSGFIESCDSTSRPLIVNVDAHLDVRDPAQGLNSGTPFRRLIEKYRGQFDLIEVGIQPQCNAQAHIDWLAKESVPIIWRSDLDRMGTSNALEQALEGIKASQPVWISLDIDAFQENLAPGCSQSWASGLQVNHWLELLQFLGNRYQIKGLSIYEVSPPLDVGNQTSKLAALCLYQFMHCHNGTGSTHARIW